MVKTERVPPCLSVSGIKYNMHPIGWRLMWAFTIYLMHLADYLAGRKYKKRMDVMFEDKNSNLYQKQKSIDAMLINMLLRRRKSFWCKCRSVRNSSMPWCLQLIPVCWWYKWFNNIVWVFWFFVIIVDSHDKTPPKVGEIDCIAVSCVPGRHVTPPATSTYCLVHRRGWSESLNSPAL
jgi:hypothetical protein